MHCSEGAHFADEETEDQRGPSAGSCEDSWHPGEQRSLGMSFLDGLF